MIATTSPPDLSTAPAASSALAASAAPPPALTASARAALSSPSAPARTIAGVYLLLSPRPDPAFDSAATLLSAALDALVPARFGRLPAAPITVFVFPTRDAYDAFCRSHFSSARTGPSSPSETETCLSALGIYFHPRRELVVDAARGRTTLTHELAHTLLEADFPSAPLWLDEGLGALYEWPDFPPEGGIRGKSNFRHQRLLDALASPAERASVRLDALFGMRDEAFVGAPARGEAREAAKLLHYAMARDACRWLDAMGKLWPLYREWRDYVGVDPTGEAAFARVLGETPRQANDAWIAWVRDPKNDDRTPGRVP